MSKATEIENTFGVIFQIPPERIGAAIIANLDQVYRSGLIEASLKDYSETDFKMGIRNVSNRKREVIIGPIPVTVNDVYAIRGPTQSVADYANALDDVFEEPETAEEKSVELYERLESHNLVKEHAAWIYGGQARQVLRAAIEGARGKGADTTRLTSPEGISGGADGGLYVIPLR